MAAAIEFRTHQRLVDPRRRSKALTLAMVAAASIVVSLTAVAAAGGADAHTATGSVGVVPVVSGEPQRSGEYVVVGPGDTLHSVAVDHAPGADPGEFVEAMMVLNGMAPDGSRIDGTVHADRSVEVGQVLALPRVDR